MIFFWDYSLAIVKQEFVKILLALIGIAVGVGVYGATRIANSYISQEFDGTAFALAGQEQIQVSAFSGGISSALVKQVQDLPGVESVQAHSSDTVFLKSPSSPAIEVQLIGLDILQGAFNRYFPVGEGLSQDQIFSLLRYESALASPELVRKLGGSTENLQVIGSASPIKEVFPLSPSTSKQIRTGAFLIVDISFYQEITRKFGVIEQIDITLAEDTNLEDFQKLTKSKLDSSVRIEPASQRSKRYDNMTKAFRLNLNFLAGISLLVSVLLIFNTISFLLVKQRRDIGVLICLGARRAYILACYLVHVLLLGLVGSLCGLLLAKYLSQYSLQAVASTVSNLYTPIETPADFNSPLLMFEILISGIIATLIGAVLPALEIRKVSAISALQYQRLEERIKLKTKMFTAIGVLLIFLGVLSSDPSILKLSLKLGFIPPALFCVGIVLLIPVFLSRFCNLVNKLSFRLNFVELGLAVDHLQSKIGRSSIVIAAIALSIGMLFGVSTMIYSFRSTVGNWLETVIQADLFVSVDSGQASRLAGNILPETQAALESYAEYDQSSTNYTLPIVHGDREVLLRGHGIVDRQRFGGLQLKDALASSGWQSFKKGKSVLISESFQSKFDLNPGDSLKLNLPTGEVNISVSGIAVDYTSEHGVIIMEESLFKDLTSIETPQGLAIYLKPGSSTEDFFEWYERQTFTQNLFVRDSKQLKKNAFEVFDNTFRLTYAVQIMSMFISILVLLNALLMLFLEWKRELMTLKAIGAAHNSLVRVVISESMLMSLVALVFASIIGAVLSILLVFVINKHFFGWSIELTVPWMHFPLSGISVLFLGYLIGSITARLSLKKVQVGALRYE